MPLPSETSSPALSGTIARSRSRYKGARPNRLLTSTQEPPSTSADRFQQFREDSSPANRRQEAPVNVMHTKPIARLSNKILNETPDLKNLDIDVKAPPGVRRSFQSRIQAKRDDTADNSCPKAERNHLGPIEQQEALKDHEPRDRRARLHPRRLEEQPAASRPLALPKKNFTQLIVGQKSGHRPPTSREELKRTISGPVVVEPPQSIVTPAFDAPISAVNAGERRVIVKHGQSTMSLPVTPLTTPTDIIRLAGGHLQEPISPDKSVVLEAFRQLGLERPLRRYEHIRDILNSWDKDTQHTLIIVPSPTAGRDPDLELNCVPRVQPGDTSVSIYHSQRPGHWNKRWVSLRSDGQILVAKKDGGETSNICHLSDFDIYTPTARQLSKKIRPPRKICFAVKSQQKSSMFMSTVNFVHFFSTSDKTLAIAWYKAIQEWRSWYLVHVMGEGHKAPESPEIEIGSVGPQTVTDSQKKNSHSRTSNGSGNLKVETVRDSASCGSNFRNRAALPASYPKNLTKDAETSSPAARENGPSTFQTSPVQNPKAEPFVATGLLGRTYTQRQKAQQRQEAGQSTGSGPLPTLSFATGQSDILKRTSSQRPKPKPLIDLTPQYREPPQHTRKGRGVVPEQIPPGGLIEIATGPDAAVEVPSSTTWQRTNTSSGHDFPGFQRSSTIRRDHHGHPSKATRQASTSPRMGDVPLMGDLLANKNKGQGGIRTGRGVMTGDRQAKAPMMDAGEQRTYAFGSLLDRVDKQDGISRAVVER